MISMKKIVVGTLTACMVLSGAALAKAENSMESAVNAAKSQVITNSFKVNCSDLLKNLPCKLNVKWCTGSGNTQKPEITLPGGSSEDKDNAGDSSNIGSSDKDNTEDSSGNETPNTPSETPVTPGGNDQTGSTENGGQTTEQSSYAEKVLSLVNAERAKQGLSALTLDQNLSAVAYAHSKDMAQRNFFSHTNPDGQSPFDRMKANGISYKTAAENIAVGQSSPEQVVSSWMNSEGHRKNILNGNFNKMGIGLYETQSGYRYYWTQCFTD